MITLLLSLLTMVIVPAAAMAQIISSSISGTVIDPEKAVVVNATVTVSTASNAKFRQIKTNSQGFFNVVDLQPGTYSIIIEAKGFDMLAEPEIVVTAAQNMSLGQMQLTVGKTSDTITVTSNTSGIDTESANTENQLSTEELEKIQVRSYDIMDALTLLPGNVDMSAGTHDAPNTTSGSNTYTDGMRNSSKNVMIDGVASTDPGNGGTINTLPSVGMIQELKVTASNFRADSGRNAGPSVILVTKSGTQAVHGSFNFPFRNEFFDANDPDQKRQGLGKAPYRLALPDVTVTGPLLIPHLISARQHLFFTASFQYQSQSQNPVPSTKLITVPSILERQGDFSLSNTYVVPTATSAGYLSPVCLTNYVTANGVTTKTCASKISGITETLGGTQPTIQPLGQQILNLFPLPNLPPTALNGAYFNYRSDSVSTTRRQSELYRIDWQPGSNISMYFRVLYSPETDQAAWSPGNNSVSGGFSNISFNDGYFQNKSLGTGFLYNITETFSPTLVNTIGLSTSTIKKTGSALSPASITAAGTGVTLPQLYPGANAAGYLPNIMFGCQNIPNTSACPSTLYQDAGIAAINLDAAFPDREHLHSFQITDNLTKTWRTHSFVAGVYWEAVHRNYTASGANTVGTNDRGSYSFQSDSYNPCDTGNPWANVLTGCIDSYLQNSTRPEAYLRFKNNEAYFQDEWRVTPRLTLSYGLRFYHDPPAHDALNQYQVFVPARYNRSLAPRLYMPSSTCNTVNGVTVTQCADDPATGTQVAYGLRVQYVPGSSPLANAETNGIVQAGTNGVPRSIFTNPYVSLAPRFGFNYALTNDSKTIVKGGWGLYYDRYPLQNQLNMLSNPPANQVISLDDIQSFSQLSSMAATTSPPQLTTLPLGRFIPPTTKSYSLEIQRQLGNDGLLGVAYIGNNSQHQVARQEINAPPLYAQLYTLHPENIDYSQKLTACGGAPCMLSTSLLSPYYGFGSIYMQAMTASANYNGLQTSLMKKYFHRHVQLRGNWTYSKTMGMASGDYQSLITNPAEPLRAYSPLSYDRRNIVNFLPIVDLPDPGRVVNSRFISGVGRGWSISGTWRFSSGAPFTPGLYLSGVPGAGGNGQIGSAGNVVTGSFDNARPVLVNKNAKITVGDKNGVFTGPSVGTWGNVGQNQFHLPSWQEFDATFYRTFQPTKKLSMIFRTEVYNIPNSTIVNSLNTVLQYSYDQKVSSTVTNYYPYPVPSTPGAALQQNSAFYTAASGAGLNGNTTNFFRRGRVIQFDLSGRW
jgi:hypothetical protein